MAATAKQPHPTQVSFSNFKLKFAVVVAKSTRFVKIATSGLSRNINEYNSGLFTDNELKSGVVVAESSTRRTLSNNKRFIIKN